MGGSGGIDMHGGYNILRQFTIWVRGYKLTC